MVAKNNKNTWIIAIVVIIGAVFLLSTFGGITGKQINTKTNMPNNLVDRELFKEEPIIISSKGVPPSVGYEREEVPVGGPTHLWDAFSYKGISSSTFTQPKVFDLDLDGRNEIISTLSGVDVDRDCRFLNGLYVWDENGNLKPNFPVELNIGQCGAVSIVGVGDVVGDNKLEIVIAIGNSGNGGGIYVVLNNGQILSEIESDSAFSGGDSMHAVLNDLDNDGKLEILASSFEELNSKLYIWRGDGSYFPGWPVDPPSDRLGEPLVVDLRSNGIKNILVANHPTDPFQEEGHAIIAYNLDGTINWLFDIDQIGHNFLFTSNKLFAADINGGEDEEEVDGSKEIVLHTADNYILILNKDGNKIGEWYSTVGDPYPHMKDITIGDLNKDGQMEIIYHDEKKIFVTNSSGKAWQGFPLYIFEEDPNKYYPLTNLGIADLDGDGFPDIYGQALNKYGDRGDRQGEHMYAIFAFDRFGNALDGFPFQRLKYEDFPDGTFWTYVEKYQPTFADINKDGIADMVTSKGWGRIEAFTLNSRYNKNVAYFPQYGVDEKNTKFVPTRRFPTPIPPSP